MCLIFMEKGFSPNGHLTDEIFNGNKGNQNISLFWTAVSQYNSDFTQRRRNRCGITRSTGQYNVSTQIASVTNSQIL